MKFLRMRVLVIMLTLSFIITAYITSTRFGVPSYVSEPVAFVLVPFKSAFSYVDTRIKDTMVYFNDIKRLQEENEQLKEELEQMQRDSRELEEYRHRITELQNALGIKDRFVAYDIHGANIIGKGSGNWFETFTIDLGTRDGVTVNSPVITGRGLVGRVSNTDLFTSTVISILDPDSTVSSRVTKTREVVIVKGDAILKNSGFARLDYIPEDVDISRGDLIETSGYGGIFPKGIIVGRVGDMYRGETGFMQYAQIEPVVDFKKLEEVFVLTPKN